MSARGARWARERFGPPTLARGLATVIAAASSPSTNAAATGSTYDPSEFAHRLDAHKRACLPWPIALDPTRHVADDADPLWPQRRYLSPLEWETLRRVDGTAAVAQLAEQIAATGLTVTPAALATTLWRLHVGGLLLFRS